MLVTVKLFAQLREAAGAAEATLELMTGDTGEFIRAELGTRFPGMGPLLGSARLAVNEEYAPWTAAIGAGDTVALIPPVSGG